MTDPKVCLLDGGTLVIDHSQVMWHHNVGTPVRFPVYSVLVEHPDALILFDTGYDLDHVNRVLPFELPEQTPEQTIPEQLRLCGFKPEDVDIVVNSHFHFDHVGGNKHLPNAKVLVNKHELRHALVPENFEKLGYSDLSFHTDTTKYEVISGDYQIVPGVELIETPGHTVGHYSMLVEMQSRASMLFAGDAAYTTESLDKLVIGGFHQDPTNSVDSLRRLNYIARTRGAEVFPSHDQASFETWDLAPSSYGG